jgi:hypothetical protein
LPQDDHRHAVLVDGDLVAPAVKPRSTELILTLGKAAAYRIVSMFNAALDDA